MITRGGGTVLVPPVPDDLLSPGGIGGFQSLPVILTGPSGSGSALFGFAETSVGTTSGRFGGNIAVARSGTLELLLSAVRGRTGLVGAAGVAGSGTGNIVTT